MCCACALVHGIQGGSSINVPSDSDSRGQADKFELSSTGDVPVAACSQRPAPARTAAKALKRVIFQSNSARWPCGIDVFCLCSATDANYHQWRLVCGSGKETERGMSVRCVLFERAEREWFG